MTAPSPRSRYGHVPQPRPTAQPRNLPFTREKATRPERFELPTFGSVEGTGPHRPTPVTKPETAPYQGDQAPTPTARCARTRPLRTHHAGRQPVTPGPGAPSPWSPPGPPTGRLPPCGRPSQPTPQPGPPRPAGGLALGQRAASPGRPRANPPLLRSRGRGTEQDVPRPNTS
jgi:hypothetical protein